MLKEWKAKWIMDKKFMGLAPINVFHKQNDTVKLTEHKPDLKNHHMLVRKVFEYNGNINGAYIDITADDYYKLYINGQYVCQGPAPAYYFHYYYNRLDLSGYLKTGKNTVAVHVYYQGLINRVWNSGDQRQGLIGELFINDDLCLISDSSWKHKTAEEFTGKETIGYETQYLENIDFRLKADGWYLPDFNDNDWESACENPADDHKLVLQPTPALEVYEIKPVSCEKLGSGHYLLDFGQEITGQFKMTAKGDAGDAVEILCGEELEDGDRSRVRYNMRCNCSYREKMILSGRIDTLEHYDYKAFRYVEVISDKDDVIPGSFFAIARHYPFSEEKCRFETSDKLLNDIWNICRNAVKYGTQEVYVDCPSREKGQYLGDATITAHSHIYLCGDARLYKKSLLDFALSKFICTGLMAVAPGSYMQEIADFSLQWPYQLLNYYKQSGDMDFLKEMHPIAEGILQYFKKFARKDGLLQNVKEKWNLVDWPDNLRDGYDFDLSAVAGDGCHNVINAFYCGAVKIINEIRDELGIEYIDEFPELKEAYIRAFYKKELKLFSDSETSEHTSLHSNIMPLFYRLVPDEAVASIVSLVRKKRLCCGVYIAYFLLKGLAAAGEYNLVYELITSKDEHSWANMLKEGATTSFEAWGKNQKWNTSLCHPWSSAPISVIIEDIIGLKPAKPGWKEISFTPHIPEALKSLKLEFSTIHNIIKVDYENGKASVSILDL